MIKFCKKCNCETDRYKDGSCKPCAAIYRTKYKAANADAIRKYSAEYYAANREKIRENVKRYIANNSSKISEIHANYYAKNKDRLRALRDPRSHRINEQNRAARKRASGGKLSKCLSDRLFNLQRGKCACGCGQPLGNDYHLDHIMPLALGGSNTDDNIQLLTATCNLQKKAKHPVDFMRQRGFLL